MEPRARECVCTRPREQVGACERVPASVLPFELRRGQFCFVNVATLDDTLQASGAGHSDPAMKKLGQRMLFGGLHTGGIALRSHQAGRGVSCLLTVATSARTQPGR